MDKRNKFYAADTINDHVTRISGMGGEKAFLIEGSERACLFDGCSGVGSLKAFVRELTELPVFMVLSHAHPDHCGAAFEYGECFMHPDDIGLLYTDFASGAEGRLGYDNNGRSEVEKMTVGTMADVVPAHAIRTYPCYDGDLFDLGGRKLEVIHVPGHTRGSIVLLDRDDRILYSADAINPNTLFGMIGATTIEEYKDSVLHLKEYQNAFDRMYGGHGPLPQTPGIIDDALMLCDKILAGEDDQIETPDLFTGETVCVAAKRGENFMPEYGGESNIVYRKDRIRGRKGQTVLKGAPFIDRLSQ
ncbi:MAG: MBL fold metallo-hydrolase [Lachnospiraceae bacterium]|nr:MBL fold metallo-hydrolase [Lachnospiraceae bacterium]